MFVQIDAMLSVIVKCHINVADPLYTSARVDKFIAGNFLVNPFIFFSIKKNSFSFNYPSLWRATWLEISRFKRLFLSVGQNQIRHAVSSFSILYIFCARPIKYSPEKVLKSISKSQKCTKGEFFLLYRLVDDPHWILSSRLGHLPVLRT